MAKAIFGHVGGLDPRLMAELQGLRRRVHELEIELSRARAVNEALAARVDVSDELLAERGVVVDHTTVYRWVRRFTPLFIEAARPCRH